LLEFWGNLSLSSLGSSLSLSVLIYLKLGGISAVVFSVFWRVPLVARDVRRIPTASLSLPLSLGSHLLETGGFQWLSAGLLAAGEAGRIPTATREVGRIPMTVGEVGWFRVRFTRVRALAAASLQLFFNVGNKTIF
jgi:hypothetical protein